jgi:hypothetical protein
MKNQKKAPEKKAPEIVPEGMVTVELTKDHPHFNPKIPKVTATVSAALAAKGVKSGHFKLVK